MHSMNQAPCPFLSNTILIDILLIPEIKLIGQNVQNRKNISSVDFCLIFSYLSEHKWMVLKVSQNIFQKSV